jgi:hypothetical protein
MIETEYALVERDVPIVSTNCTYCRNAVADAKLEIGGADR